MKNLNEPEVEIRSDLKIQNDFEQADQLFFKLENDIGDFFDKLDISQESFEESAYNLGQIFQTTLSNNIIYIYKQIESGFLYQIEYGHDFRQIHESIVFEAVNSLIWRYFGSEEDYDICNYLSFDFISNNSIFIKNNIFKKFYCVSKTFYVLDISFDEFVDAYCVDIDANSLSIAFDLCGLSVELAIVEMVVQEEREGRGDFSDLFRQTCAESKGVARHALEN